jgi:hypothetical protein
VNVIAFTTCLGEVPDAIQHAADPCISARYGCRSEFILEIEGRCHDFQVITNELSEDPMVTNTPFSAAATPERRPQPLAAYDQAKTNRLFRTRRKPHLAAPPSSANRSFLCGVLGLVIALALRATGCLSRYSMRWAADRLLARMLQLFARACTGCSLAAELLWRRHLRRWQTWIAIARTLLVVALTSVTLAPGAPALGGPAAFAANPAHVLVRSDARVRIVHYLGAVKQRRGRFGALTCPPGRACVSAPSAPSAQPRDHIDDSFASMLLE